MKISIESVNKDLEKLQQKFGTAFILVLCASLIMEHCDWNWDKIKTGILTDPDSKQLTVETGHVPSQR